MDFRAQLVTMEGELLQLRAKVRENHQQQVKQERTQRETARLKGIINNQQHQVHVQLCTSDTAVCILYMYQYWYPRYNTGYTM